MQYEQNYYELHLFNSNKSHSNLFLFQADFSLLEDEKKKMHLFNTWIIDDYQSDAKMSSSWIKKSG